MPILSNDITAGVRPRKCGTTSLGQVCTRAVKREGRRKEEREKERERERDLRHMNSGRSVANRAIRAFICYAGPIPRERIRSGERCVYRVVGEGGSMGGGGGDDERAGGEKYIENARRSGSTFHSATARSASFLRTWIRSWNARRTKSSDFDRCSLLPATLLSSLIIMEIDKQKQHNTTRSTSAAAKRYNVERINKYLPGIALACSFHLPYRLVDWNQF